MISHLDVDELLRDLSAPEASGGACDAAEGTQAGPEWEAHHIRYRAMKKKGQAYFANLTLSPKPLNQRVRRGERKGRGRKLERSFSNFFCLRSTPQIVLQEKSLVK